ncbi:hypothetical protein AAY53_17845 [Vibrio metoecus]|nr:hypothetical protein AAY53_17845 [Vibrio metoecus]
MIKTPIGLDIHGELVHVNSLDIEHRGLTCSLVCPNCHVDLVANLGQKKVHYFSHSNNSSCNGESIKHVVAKLVVKKAKDKRLSLPDITTLNKRFRYYFDNRRIKNPDLPECFLIGDVYLEYVVSKLIKTDCLVKGILDLCVEIRNTHAKSCEDISNFKKANLFAIEIDIREIDLSLSLNEIEQYVLENAPRIWLSNPIHNEKIT